MLRNGGVRAVQALAVLLQGGYAHASLVKAVPLANGVAHPQQQSSLDAYHAQEAAESAKDAAAMANQVAQHSVKVAKDASAALKQAQHALHDARATATNLTPVQKDSLANAEGHLFAARRALKGNTSQPTASGTGELENMQTELKDLREQLANCKNGKDKSVEQMDLELQELEGMIKSLEAAQKANPQTPATHSELKVEIEHLRDSIMRLEKYGDHTVSMPSTCVNCPENGELRYRMRPHMPHPKVQLTPLADLEVKQTVDAAATAVAEEAVPAPCPPRYTGGIDIDTNMPYGDLEAFGREDTAQELTEASIHESDKMVDQLERAEVAEEKRAVFRALTRLRGAAITSFDGVARSQTGNIDEYNKVHKWRVTHPLRHLADEESDITKWAFPDNADF
eukprot:TRINITY_DN10053_c0_g1_i1.p1 TRINITY_DN10053_c0_g1~~TRINITY_DN10053_c0_g1_i1.p1  ORF type:complete len:396 (+),score=97.03 TRINITY_DN10053_c0_g1_i1:83-1270(+)